MRSLYYNTFPETLYFQVQFVKSSMLCEYQTAIKCALKNEQLAATRERDLDTKKGKYHNDPEKKRDATKKTYNNKKESIKQNKQGKYLENRASQIMYQEAKYQENPEMQIAYQKCR